MNFLKVSIFGSLIDIHTANSSDAESYKLKVFNYLENLKYHNDFKRLKEISSKLDELKKYECINASGELQDLNGKLVVIDFWTYCCVNCMHIIPLINRIEKEYEQIAVLGVHSSKFSNEKIAENIINATRRHLIGHPVVLDFNLDIWNMFEIICWPTLLVVSPEGIIISLLEGEIQASYLEKFIPVCLNYYEKLIGKTDSYNLSLAINSNYPSAKMNDNLNALSFPSKVCVDKENKILFISDSGNSRIVTVSIETKKVEFIIGSGNRGLLNGSFEIAQFDWPQGMSYDSKNKLLYIADSFNDRIRVANLKTRLVTTVCGITNNNKLGHYDLIGGKRATEQAIKTPWDVCLIEKEEGIILAISCTGTHQIWIYLIGDSAKNKTERLKWWNGQEIEWDTVKAIAGNGKERNKNNLYPLQASFSQPSGISLGNNDNCIYIADAESSSVRVLDLEKGSVKSIAGGDLEPDNLFSYGDVDGIGYSAKLQHPLDVAYLEKDVLLLVDTYNSSLKQIDLKTKHCHKLLNKSSLELNEPSGIWIDEKTIWIADSNNHSIKFIENFDKTSNSYELKEFLIQFEDKIDHIDKKVAKICLNNNNILNRILVKFSFDINEKADNNCKVNILRKKEVKEESLVHLKKLINENVFFLENFHLNIEDLVEITLNFNLIICTQSDSGAEICKMLKSTKKFSKNEVLKILEKNKGTLTILIEK